MSSNQQILLGEGAGGGIPNYIEEVFNTFVWTGTGSNQTLTTGVDTSTFGGLFWTKNRTNVFDHALWSTNFSLAGNYLLKSNTTGALTYGTYGTGDYGSNSTTGVTVYGNSQNYVTWTFRKQPKFFDIVTYTGNDTARSISHSLGSVPGCIIVKCTSSSGFNWVVYHRSLGATQWLKLNLTDAVATNATYFPSDPTSTVFNIGAGGLVNSGSDTFVAYLFAHDAGGFGLAGTDNVISCGTFTGTGAAGNAVTLGYEPQWVMIKRVDSTGNWNMQDVMRQMSLTNNLILYANLSNAEFDAGGAIVYPTATGFTLGTGSAGWNASGGTYIYIAIRRGPMKVPTVGTSVYDAEAFTGTGATRAITTLSAPDMAWIRDYKNFTNSNTIQVYDRLRGNGVRLRTGLTNADNTNAAFLQFNNQMLATVGNDSETNGSGALNVAWAFKRAPGFFDVVCYTGNGASGRTIAHNLGVTPEMMILKSRSDSGTNYQWFVYHKDIPPTPYATNLVLNGTSAAYAWSEIIKTPTTTTFGINDSFGNTSASTFVAYLFATCAGVSKVGSYTGNGSSQTIACGFAAGSRFVMIKRTDSTGDWYVWDSARGIIAGNDPHLSLNTTVAEVATDDSVDTDNSGFIVNQLSATNVNVTSATYIFLAIA